MNADLLKNPIYVEFARLGKLGKTVAMVGSPLRLERSRYLVRLFNAQKIEIGSALIDGTLDSILESCNTVQKEIGKVSQEPDTKRLPGLDVE